MEKASEEKKNEYPEELKEQGAAALLLASLKYKIIDKKTASSFCASKRRIVKKRESKRNAEKLSTRVKQVLIEETLIKPRHPQVSLSIDDYTTPAEPPVACLSGLMGICSKPFEKQLTSSDVKDDQSRLLIHTVDVTSSLLPLVNERERNILSTQENKDGIPVTTYDLDGNQYPMKFKKWSNSFYVLTSGWKRFCNDHGLRKHQDFVTVWMFRHAETANLCFVITWRRLPVYELISRKGDKKQ